MIYYAWVLSIDGESYRSAESTKYKDLEKTIDRYRHASDVAKVEAFKRYSDGTSEKIGTFWKHKKK